MLKWLTVPALLLSLFVAAAPAAAETLDTTPRTAVMSAYQPEWVLLQSELQGRKDHAVNGTGFATGTLEGKPVLLFLSGISMVNAAMTTQLALDHFTVDRIVFSGIAGGVDPDLTIGDVVVPEQWSEYLEAVFAREKSGTYELPAHADKPAAHFGMIYPQPVKIINGGETEKRNWFPVDPGLLAVARAVASTTVLQDCAAQNCLDHLPRIVVGGNGVSGQAFVDNKEFREYARSAFAAEVLDMESAAVAHVAYVNAKPFIAFRSLSDLAGGGEGENEIGTFFQLASDNAAKVVRAFLKALK
ncbi:phosphorylase [Hypericibacter terrae]|uniref:Phosphorylase n=1 Tax=Hypericibacter terrae TaxID=2602015 RepID=A0A5J6ML77_9PROT|nr:5'-methylthioadenosine/S-adenosylhomocysteine nucleosidase [Hypericibacter terrae]QEX18134.1 phosphorylase [Hypericibacter terrae]